jgi:hypothetical protein
MTTDITGLAAIPFNHGCTARMVDPRLDTPLVYDFKYIEQTVYKLALSNSSLGHSVRQALKVIEKAYQDYG